MTEVVTDAKHTDVENADMPANTRIIEWTRAYINKRNAEAEEIHAICQRIAAKSKEVCALADELIEVGESIIADGKRRKEYYKADL